MKLEQYLQALRECPDEWVKTESGQTITKLTTEHGVYDNFPIYFRCDYERMIFLLLHGNWKTRKSEIELKKHLKAREGEPRFTTTLYFTDSPVCCQVFDSSNPTLDLIYLNLRDRRFDIVDDENFQRLVSEYSKRYNGHILLHSYQHKYCLPSKRKNQASQDRNIVIAIEDISDVLIREKIPACFLKVGTKYRTEPEVALSKVVYFNPSEAGVQI